MFLLLESLWVALGSRNKFRYIPDHDISHSLGKKPQECFHAFTVCDNDIFFQAARQVTRTPRIHDRKLLTPPLRRVKK